MMFADVVIEGADEAHLVVVLGVTFCEYVSCSYLPSHDDSMARFSDFITLYLVGRHADNEKYQAATGYQDKQDQLIKLTSILEQYELVLQKQLNDAGVPEE